MLTTVLDEILNGQPERSQYRVIPDREHLYRIIARIAVTPNGMPAEDSKCKLGDLLYGTPPM